MSDIAVLVVDDHALVREMLCDRIGEERGMRVIGQTSTADDAVRLCSTTHPDVVLLDIDLPGISAFDAARSMQTGCSSTRVIFLSAFVQDGYIAQALDVRAAGYLSKTTPPSGVVEAIRTVASGGTAMCQEVLDRVMLAPSAEDQGGTGSLAALLTQREHEVVTYVAQGLSQKQIAHQMSISIKTVQTHLAHAMDKLDIHDRVDLTRYAILDGFMASP
jgi:two-component system response regulator NreC